MLDTLGEAALRTLLLACVVQCVLWLLRVRQARLLLATWTVVLAASLAMPALQHLTPLRLPFGPAFSNPLIPGAAELLQQPGPEAPPPAGTGPELPAAPAPLPWVAVLYLLVTAGALLRVLLGVGLSLRLLARAVPVRPAWAAGRRVRLSRDVAGPVTIARVILLPPDALHWPAETRHAVLAHEQAHVARWDFAMLVASQLNRALFWFSPLPWWLHRRLITLTELSSDDQAMAATRDRLLYAEILLEMGRRAGPLPRGPAMARPSTLLHRVDRILLNQVSPHGVSRPQQVLLTAGMAGLSLGIASLAPGQPPDPAEAPPATLRWAAPAADQPSPPPAPSSTARQAAPQEPSPAAPPLGLDAAPQLPSALPAPAKASPLRPAAPPTRTAALLPRPAAPSPAKPPAPQAPRVPPRPRPAAAGLEEAPASPPSERAVPSRSPAAAAAPATPADADLRPALSHQVAHDPLSFQSGLEGIGSATCTGYVLVGMRAAGSAPNRPDVVPGEAVPAQALFFRKDTGTLWVRFNAFGRPPLDLPVRFARNGMTWTGEYGIAYTVQPSGGNRLAGLAALVANDSARLDFSCSRSASHTL